MPTISYPRIKCNINQLPGYTPYIFRLPKGVYILILELPRTRRIRVGKLGELEFKRGYYAYTGSAHGPGGLGGRLKRHLLPHKKHHWHIDYLRKYADIVQVWLSEGDRYFEHQWATILALMHKKVTPVPGFGSSDCRCPSHLFHFPRQPALKAFNRLIKKTAGPGGATRLTEVDISSYR